MGEVWSAIERLAERKTAIGVGETGENVGAEGQRKMMVGLDLDIEELHEARVQTVEGVARTLEVEGKDWDDLTPEVFGVIIAGMWVDGLMTGMMIEEGRH